MEITLLPATYAGPIEYYARLLGGNCRVEQCGTWHKQTFANRCEILGPNGVEKLIIPVEKPEQHTPLQRVRISYRDPWAEQHLGALSAAYGSAPFYDFYIDELARVYRSREPLLVEFDRQMEKTILHLLRFEGLTPDYTNDWTPEQNGGIKDLRNVLNPKKKAVTLNADFEPPYWQVFGSRYGFTSGLSVLDLMMNTGNEARTYLININNKINNSFYGNS